MDLMPGNLSRIIFDCFDLPMPVFRGSKEPIRKKLSLQLRIHKPLVSANAVIIWCMECIWISYCMQRLYVWEAKGLTSTSLLHLHKSFFIPFSVLFLGQVIFS
jgi:hypothetical protein